MRKQLAGILGVLVSVSALQVQAAPFFFSSSSDIHVKCEVAGYKGDCLLDTGARVSWLPVGANTSGLEPSTPETLGGASNVTHTRETVIAHSIRMSENQVSNLKMTLPLEHERVPGLGSDFLIRATAQGRALHFSFDDMTVNVRPTTLQVNRLALIKGVGPGMRVKVGGEEALALWDTGAAGTVIDQKLVERHLDVCTQLQMDRAEIRDSSNVLIESKVYACEKIEIGPLVVEHVTVLTSDLEAFGQRIGVPLKFVIGTDVMLRYNWIIDYHGRTWSASPVKTERAFNLWAETRMGSMPPDMLESFGPPPPLGSDLSR